MRWIFNGEGCTLLHGPHNGFHRPQNLCYFRFFFRHNVCNVSPFSHKPKSVTLAENAPDPHFIFQLYRSDQAILHLLCFREKDLIWLLEKVRMKG